MALTKNCLKTTRTQIGTIDGYPIFSEHNIYYHRSPFDNTMYDTSLVSDERTYYGLGIKGGNIYHSSDRYSYCCYSIEEAKKLIEKIKDGKIVLTEKERMDWVLKPNSKHDWGFNTDMLLNLMRAYKKATPRRRVGYLERLEDANFHTEYALLEEENYAEFERVVRKL